MEEPLVSEWPNAFRFGCAGVVSTLSSPESMMIISSGVDGIRIGGECAPEPKKECKVAVFPAGVAFSFFGLWERGMKWDGDGECSQG